jgi:hypothetical protein
VIGLHQSVLNEVDVVAAQSPASGDPPDERRGHDALRGGPHDHLSLYIPDSAVEG